MNATSPHSDVLTLEEAADYLRISKELIREQALKGRIPGRRIDQHWRFLKNAIDEWLRNYTGRDLLMNQAGALADDATLAALRDAIYLERERPESDSQVVS